jgi:nucleotide-binding universal stress UspA family protein
MAMILVPLDGSAIAERVVQFLRRMVDKNDTVIFLTVEEYLAPPKKPDEIDSFHEGRMQVLQGYCEDLKSRGVMAKAVLKYGNPGNTILAYAKEAGVGTIVMSTHGRTGLQKVLYGSVAGAVLFHFPGEVVLVRPRWEALKS